MNDNGILARIPGQYVSEATKGLPDPETSKEETIEIEYDVPDIGRVHFTAERLKAKRAKHSHYFWSVSRATLVEWLRYLYVDLLIFPFLEVWRYAVKRTRPISCDTAFHLHISLHLRVAY